MKSKTPRKKPVRISKRPFVAKTVKARIKRLRRDFEAMTERLFSKQSVGVSWDDVAKKIAKRWGLKMFEHSGLSGIAFKSEKFGLVLKSPYLCSDPQPPRHGIFTESFRPQVPCDNWDPIFIQPLADVSHHARRTAYELFEEAIMAGKIESSDTHSGNVALYKGKAVVIDW